MRHVLVLALALAGACVPDRPVHTRLDRALAGVPCASEAGRALRAWGASSVGLPGPPTPAGPTLRIPTGELGAWVVVAAADDGITLSRIDQRGSAVRTYDTDCVLRERTSPAPTPAPGPSGVFTDQDLRRAREGADGALIVYAWSPHMPLSVDGYAEIAGAAESLGLTVVPVLIAHADGDFARREATRVGIPQSGLRSIASVDLVLRDAQVHAPSILVYGRSRVSPVLPGYRNADGYRRFLEAFLAAGRQAP